MALSRHSIPGNPGAIADNADERTDFLLIGEPSPLRIFQSDFVMRLSEDELEMIAGEDALVRSQRERLEVDIGNYEAATKVLRGSA